VPHYTLVTSGGESLGAVELAGQDWKPGMRIFRGRGKPNLHVLDVLVADESEAFRAACCRTSRTSVGSAPPVVFA